VGIKANKARKRVAPFEILMLRSFPWKNTNRLYRLRLHNGKKIVIKEIYGCLYIGIMK
jgi:hypothetical protein